MRGHLGSAAIELSVCTITDRSPGVVALALEPWREVADEIVVALDERAPREGLDALEAVADRIVPWRYRAPLEVNLGPVHRLCRGDWVLRVDGDEIPSRALLRRLERDDWHRDVTHVYLTRRWLFPDADRALDEHPWTPDFQLRLIRNMPGLVRFPTVEHELPVVPGPGRFLEEPLLHLDLLIATEEERRDKAGRYERNNPGMRTEDGRPQNLGFYLPESRVRPPRTTPVDPEDRELVEAFRDALLAPEPRAGTSSASVPPVDGSPPPPRPGDAHLEIVDRGADPWVGRGRATITVAVTNRGEHDWDPSEDPPVGLGARLFVEGDPAPVAETRAQLPCVVRAGARELVRIEVGPLPRSGPVRAEIDLLREGVAWFDAAVTVEAGVAARPRVVIGSGISATRHLGDDLIVRTAIAALRDAEPDAEPVVLADDPPGAVERFSEAAVHGAGPVVHHEGTVTDLGEALRRVDALVEDARRFGRGEPILSAQHAPIIHLLAETDVLVLLGAGWFVGEYWQAQLLPHLAEAEVARALGVPVFFEAGSLGPIGRAEARAARRLLATFERISIRDETLTLATARRLRVATDSWVAVPDVATAARAAAPEDRDAWLDAHGIEGPYALVSLRSRAHSAASRDGDFEDRIVEALHELERRKVNAVFLAQFEDGAGGGDVDTARVLADRTSLLVPEAMPDDDLAVALVADARMTLGNRFHLAVLADAAGTPGVLVPGSVYDTGRAGALTGGNVEVLGSARPGDGARAVAAALDRGRGRPAAVWDPDPLLGAISARLDRHGPRR